jgi:TatD DNase family protein
MMPRDNLLIIFPIAFVSFSLLDDRFIRGVYRGTYRHESDLDLVFERARQAGVDKLILTAGTIEDSRTAVQVARHWNRLYPGVTCYSTVGVHPTRCQQVFVDHCSTTGGDAALPPPDDTTDEDLLQELLQIARDGQSDGTVVAIGEIGLDYDRLEFCPKDVQHKYLIRQLQVLASATKLPLFLHNRSVGSDLYDVLCRYRECWESGGGVVHSFDDTSQLAERFTTDLNLSIGLNGCSLRSEQNLETVRTIPLDRILLETEYASPMTTNVARRFPFNSLLLALLIVFDVAAQLPLL